MTNKGDRGSTVVKVLCYKSEGRWFDPSWCHWIFHWNKILPIALWPWGWHSLEQKWVPGVFPGGKGDRCIRLTTLPPSCAVVTKSGNLNFQETSGPVQVCNVTPLPLLWPTYVQLTHKLSHSYMFRHYRVILMELVISTLPGYTLYFKCSCW